MRLNLLSPDAMSKEQREIYDESIASKRGRPPEPMFAWLHSPDMARQATRLGAFLATTHHYPQRNPSWPFW